MWQWRSWQNVNCELSGRKGGQPLLRQNAGNNLEGLHQYPSVELPHFALSILQSPVNCYCFSYLAVAHFYSCRMFSSVYWYILQFYASPTNVEEKLVEHSWIMFIYVMNFAFNSCLFGCDFHFSLLTVNLLIVYYHSNLPFVFIITWNWF